MADDQGSPPGRPAGGGGRDGRGGRDERPPAAAGGGPAGGGPAGGGPAGKPGTLLADLARLRRQTRTPIALNESVTTPEISLQILQLHAADVVLPDTYQCAGILGVKKVAALAEAAGVTCVFHCAHDLGLKTAAMLHVVASSPSFTLANDCTYYGLEDDIITPLHRIERGRMAVPEGPGLGVTVDEKKIAKYRV